MIFIVNILYIFFICILTFYGMYAFPPYNCLKSKSFHLLSMLCYVDVLAYGFEIFYDVWGGEMT